MNEQLQIELAKLVGMLNNGAEKVAEFGAEQIPIVLQQLLLWHSVESFLWFLVGIIGSFATYKMSVRAFKKPPEGESNFMWERNGTIDVACMPVGFGLAFPAMFFVSMVGLNLDWLKIMIAPNLYLLEYAAGLVK